MGKVSFSTVWLSIVDRLNDHGNIFQFISHHNRAEPQKDYNCKHDLTHRKLNSTIQNSFMMCSCFCENPTFHDFSVCITDLVLWATHSHKSLSKYKATKI